MSTHHSQPRSYEFRTEDRLRMARERAGYGVRELEAVSGISRATISNYENGRFGRGGPRRPIVAAWGLATGYDVDWLLTGHAPVEDDPDGGGGMESRHARTNVYGGLLVAA